MQKGLIVLKMIYVHRAVSSMKENNVENRGKG